MSRNLAIGADIGGTHITTAVIDLDSNSVLRETMAKRDVDHSAAADEIIEQWAEAIDESAGKSPEKVKGVGIAMPGPFDYVEGVSSMEQKFVSIKDKRITPALQKKMENKYEIRYINDASAFAVGESHTEDQVKYSHIMSITLGTGLGSAFTEEGHPIVEREDVPELGCVYHLPCKDKTADDYFSTRWFVNSYEAKTGKRLKGVKEIAELFDSDPLAKELFSEFGNNLAGFLAPWLKLFDAKSLVMGGNISMAYELFREEFEEELGKQGLDIAISLSKLKEEAALIGAARLLDEDYFKIIKPELAKM